MKLFRVFSCFNCGRKVDRDVEIVYSKTFKLEATYPRESQDIGARYSANRLEEKVESSGSQGLTVEPNVEVNHSDDTSAKSVSQLSPTASISAASLKPTLFDTNINIREEEIQPVIEEEEEEEEQQQQQQQQVNTIKATIVAIATNYYTHLMSTDLKETVQVVKQASRPLVATAAMWLLFFLAFTTFVSLSVLSAVMSYMFNKEDPFAVGYTQFDDDYEKKKAIMVKQEEDEKEAPTNVSDDDHDTDEDATISTNVVVEHIQEELAQQA